MSDLLDANVFIQAKNLHYGFDFCPAFWQWLLDSSASGRAFSIDKISAEIAAGADELSHWAQQHEHTLFHATDATVMARFAKVSSWVKEQQYEAAAINTFMQVADFYLIAHALAGGHTLVTHEIASVSTRKIKIPNICIGLGIRFMTPYERLRVEKARFVLGSAA